MRRILQGLGLLLVLSMPSYAQQDDAAIQHLLATVEKSNATFIRNGDPHDGHEAAAHMKAKYQHFRREIKTPEDFIRLAGSKSLLSGKEYQVKLADGTEMPAKRWLTERLDEYRRGATAPAAHAQPAS
jgi:hypothetical protein